jgi:hypothetical protein
MCITVQLDLPDSLPAEAKAEGLLNPENLTRLVEREIALEQPMQEFRQMVEQMHTFPDEPITMDEIQSVVNEVRERRHASR